MVAVEAATEDQMDVDPSPALPPTILSAPELQPPSLSTRVFKDECMYCFHTPFFPGGIYVCLKHFAGLCANHVQEYSTFNNCKYFLRIQKFKPAPKEIEEPKDKVQRLCILADKEEEEEKVSVVVAPDFQTDVPISEQHLDAQTFHVVQAVVRHASATYQNMADAGVSDWDGGERKVLPNAEELVQLDIDKTIPYSGWKCEEPGCDLTENLWLNLHDGTILCGRAQYISEGKMSKGNGHAKTHAESIGFPVLVKLGTIHNGDADIYSYAENESVRDPYLRQHLAHFGLDINKFEKTEKSTLELELDLNQKWEWSRCQEDGVTLENIYGSGFTGLINIGSSCYINSVLQTLILDPSFVEAYTKQFLEPIPSERLVDLHEDFNFQMSRVIRSLLSGNYALEGFEFNGIKPTQFRRVAGRNHPEFSTAGQQDAGEYIAHLFQKIEETLPVDPNPVDDFRFKVVKRFKDIASKRVRYTDIEEYILTLPIPKDKLVDSDSAADAEIPQTIMVGPLPKPSRKSIDLMTLIENWTLPQYIEGFVSPVTGEPKGAEQAYSVGTFPKYLLIQVNRYEHDEFYRPHKLDVDVHIPDELDLNSIRSKGQQSGEELLPEIAELPADAQIPPKPALNQEFVQQIMDMGFPRRSAEIAVENTQSASAEIAVEWLFTHMDDPIMFEEPAATPAPETPSNAPKREKKFKDGPSKYRLRGFITHMGSSTHSGHYVCHLVRNGIWYLYNDEKVAISQSPPKSLGYIYFYEQLVGDSN